MSRQLFGKIELRFWLDSDTIRSMKPSDRAYYVDVWLLGLRHGTATLHRWQYLLARCWHCRRTLVASIVHRLATVRHNGKPLLKVLSDDKLYICGLQRVYKVRAGRQPLVTRDVEEDVDVAGEHTCASPDVDGQADKERPVDRPRAKRNPPRVTGLQPATAGPRTSARGTSTTNGDDQDQATPFPEARQWYDDTTARWDFNDFGPTSGNYLADLVTARFKHFDKAQLLIAHTRDIDLAQDIKCKPAALLHRVRNGLHAPKDASMNAAKALLSRGEMPLEDIVDQAIPFTGEDEG
jgi:hypothetical protein